MLPTNKGICRAAALQRLLLRRRDAAHESISLAGRGPAAPLPVLYSDALKRLRDPAASRRVSMFDFADPTGTDVRIVHFSRLFCRAANELHIPLVPLSFRRSPQLCRQLWLRGFVDQEASLAITNGFAFECVHARRLWSLCRCEWNLLERIGADCAYRANLTVVSGAGGGVYAPSVWYLRDWRHLDAIRFPLPRGHRLSMYL